jgi:hypothetical protein
MTQYYRYPQQIPDKFPSALAVDTGGASGARAVTAEACAAAGGGATAPQGPVVLEVPWA